MATLSERILIVSFAWLIESSSFWQLNNKVIGIPISKSFVFIFIDFNVYSKFNSVVKIPNAFL